MIRVRVKDGTNAGCRRLRVARTAPWRCPDGHENKPHHLTCFAAGCREKRPKGA